MRVYTGHIFAQRYELVFLKNLDLSTFHWFRPVGLFKNNGRIILSYGLCYIDGDPIPEYAHLQFLRSRDNHFYLFSVN